MPIRLDIADTLSYHLPPSDRRSVQLNWGCPQCKGKSFELFVKNSFGPVADTNTPAAIYQWPKVKVLRVRWFVIHGRVGSTVDWQSWRTDPEAKTVLAELIQEAKASRRAPKAGPVWLWCTKCMGWLEIPKRLLDQLAPPT